MNSDELLRVEDLVVEYSSGKSVIHAVNGVSFVLKKARRGGWWEKPVQERQR